MHQPLRVRVGQRPDQCSIHKGKHRYTCANAKRQHRNRGEREARILSQLAKCEADIAGQMVEPFDAAPEIEALPRRLRVAKLRPCSPPRLVFARASTFELVGFEFEMRFDLLGKIIDTAPAFEHAYASSLLGPALPRRINPIARVRRCQSLIFSMRWSRPFAVSE